MRKESSSHRPQSSFLYSTELKDKLQVTNFDPNAILRGAQLTIVGALRALQNPALFTSDHYRQAAIAVAAGIGIRLIINIPIIGIKVLLWFLSFIFDYGHATWDNKIIDGLDFIQNYVLQIPFFLMTLMKHVTPTLDNMFMDSLAWVDKTYYEKHRKEDPSVLREGYYSNLRKYPAHAASAKSRNMAEIASIFLTRFGKKAALSLVVFSLSYAPYIGRFVLPAASFYTFKSVAGWGPAGIVFGTSIFLSRRYLVIFLQSYFASRSLTRELLDPYFSRIRFTKEQKKHWFHDREGLLFGFGIGFYIFLRTPLLGVLIYGIAEASTAYLITKITDPPPRPEQVEGFANTQQRWRNKHDFLRMSLASLDARNLPTDHVADNPVNLSSSSSTQRQEPPSSANLRSR